MSGYGPSNWFVKLFCSALPLAKKYIEPVAMDFAFFSLRDLGSGKDSKEIVHKISGPAHDRSHCFYE